MGGVVVVEEEESGAQSQGGTKRRKKRWIYAQHVLFAMDPQVFKGDRTKRAEEGGAVNAAHKGPL